MGNDDRPSRSDQAIDWDAITLVAFDVDGTLYAQRALRLRMAMKLLMHTAIRGSRTMRVLKHYRERREELGDAETPDFENVLIGEIAARHGLPREGVRALIADWMEERPLAALARCRYPAVDALFARIRRSGRTIGILSDYPALAKLKALGLAADHVVSAGEVGLLKPHPKGLEHLMALAGASPAQTVLIGDRAERDGEAARRAGVHCLLRTSQSGGVGTFVRFDDPLFAGIDAAPGNAPRSIDAKIVA